MIIARSKPAVSRSGFTLIELLVVILIIAVLVSLTAGAVMRAITKAEELQNRNTVSQLSNALDKFKTLYGAYPPSQIKLGFKPSDYGNTQLDIDSKAFLQKMFPNMYSNWTNNGINWGGSVQANGSVTLEGEECLVFFLGGVQDTSTTPFKCLGFSTDTTSPMRIDTNRKDMPFEFQLKYLAPSPRANGFLVYSDPYGVPYGYFSSYNVRNGYNKYGSSDCPTLGVNPYVANSAAPVQYYRVDTFQIVSAGADGLFGPGGPWGPNNAAQGVGRDDVTNFHPNTMGNP